MSQAPFPSSGHFIKVTKESSRKVRELAGIQAIDTFLLSLTESNFNRLKSQHGVAFPLNFPTLLSEINFLSILALLNTLSGYRDPFHKATGQGAYQNVVKLMMGLYISDDGGDGESGVGGSLSAKGLRELKEETIASIWGVSTFSEKPHESLPGVTIGQKGGPLNEPIELAVKLCNETGERLISGGYKSLGELVVEILRESRGILERAGDAVATDHFIERLVKSIPGFADMTLLPPSTFPSTSTSSNNAPIPLYVFKKAFFLLYSLYDRLPSSENVLTPAKSNLPMFVDNVIPTMLVHLEIVDLGSTNVEALKKWGEEAFAHREQLKAAEGSVDQPKVKDGPHLTAAEAYIVRAACIDAGEAVVRRAKELQSREGLGWLGGVTEVDVDGYLWSVAKDDEVLRRVPRLVERGTIMY